MCIREYASSSYINTSVSKLVIPILYIYIHIYIREYASTPYIIYTSESKLVIPILYIYTSGSKLVLPILHIYIYIREYASSPYINTQGVC